MKLITFTVPCYNSAAYMDRCIETLLPAGEEIAARIYERHKLLTRFFIRLGVTPEVAAADACKIEHDLSDETFQKIKEHAMQGALPEQ